MMNKENSRLKISINSKIKKDCQINLEIISRQFQLCDDNLDLHKLLKNQSFPRFFSAQNRLEKRAGKFNLSKTRAFLSHSNISFP